MTSLPSVPMDALLEPPPTSDPLDAIFNLQRRRSNSERQRRTLLDIASSRSFRQVVRFASIDADLIQWKKRTVESVRTASLRAIHLQEKLDIKRQASVRHLDTERVTLTEWQQPHDLDDDDDDDDLSDAAHTLLSIPATSTTAPPAPVIKEEYKPIVHHSGWLIKRGHRNWSFKRRLFCLVGHELVYHDSHQSAPANVLGKFDLRKPTSACELANHGFALRQGSYEMLLYTSCDADRDLWLRKLADCSNVTLLAARPASSSTSSAHDNDVLLHAGWLRKQGQFMKSVKRRYFRLTAGALMYYRGPDVVKAKGSVCIGPNTSVELFDTRKTGERHSFCITENSSAKRSRVLTVFADSQEDLMIWVASLSAAIDGHHQHKRSHSSSNNQHDVLDCDTIDDQPSPTLSVGSSMSDNDSDVVAAEPQSKTDVAREIAREAQLILISPYSPEGTTSTKFLKDTSAKTMHLDAIRHFIEGLTEYMIQTRMHEFRGIAGIDGTSNNSNHDDGSFELIAQIISEQVEERVFYPLHRIVYTSLMTKTKKDVRLLQDRLELLRAKKQVYFGITAVSPSGYAAAVAVMNEIDACSLPYTKRAKLVQACKTIYAVAAAEHLVEGAMSADAFIPAFIYVVVQCHIEDILTLKDLLVAFTPMANQGETAYFVTCLEIAIEYVQSLVVLQELELNGDAPLGLEFAVDDHVVVVNRVLERSQAAACGGVDIGDVLMAINGLSADDKELVEVKRIFESVQGPVALSFVKKDDYKRVKARCQLGTPGRESAKS
ncbi:hypothetical protein SDRG_03414 [Saprolegnia diclina VS20]|uniref:VPS9 domain-containing protein n=1 Tax=Saprolegnia diclina (strain VS20) TaxID=1156394 RepID=T0QM94_SAPDV|nr:hypothetical protein SDRG_03414 [Saprolegnia diclina VS20]EQC39209.1 hypothetical protein SDRG_03414 [Saprolegnia diclina VS20]|eukprot:XP_008607270.1 hypothetical protein SDRG_03414 [Saprolegnia diclina VS20]